MALYTDFEFKAPPAGKYEGKITVATSTDEQPIAQAVADDKEARTLGTGSESEHSDDGKTRADAVEAPNSERQTSLERLRLAELESEQDLRDWKPLTKADAEAKEQAISQSNAKRYNSALDEFIASHPDFEEVVAQAADVEISEAKRQALMEAGPQATYELLKNPELAEKFSAMSDEEAAQVLQVDGALASSSQASPGRQRLDQIEAEQPGITQLCTAVAQQLHPDVLHLLDKSPFGAEVLSELALHPAGLQNILQFSPHEQAAMLTSRMWQLARESKQAQTTGKQKIAENRRLGPTRAVGGSVKSTVPLDETDYQTYRKIRNKQEKERYRR